MEPMMRSDARRAPTTFLYATDSRLRSCVRVRVGVKIRVRVGVGFGDTETLS